MQYPEDRSLRRATADHKAARSLLSLPRVGSMLGTAVTNEGLDRAQLFNGVLLTRRSEWR